jgi:hypothetical protein
MLQQSDLRSYKKVRPKNKIVIKFLMAKLINAQLAAYMTNLTGGIIVGGKSILHGRQIKCGATSPVSLFGQASSSGG